MLDNFIVIGSVIYDYADGAIFDEMFLAPVVTSLSFFYIGLTRSGFRISKRCYFLWHGCNIFFMAIFRFHGTFLESFVICFWRQTYPLMSLYDRTLYSFFYHISCFVLFAEHLWFHIVTAWSGHYLWFRTCCFHYCIYFVREATFASFSRKLQRNRGAHEWFVSSAHYPSARCLGKSVQNSREQWPIQTYRHIPMDTVDLGIDNEETLCHVLSQKSKKKYFQIGI